MLADIAQAAYPEVLLANVIRLACGKSRCAHPLSGELALNLPCLSLADLEPKSR